MPGPKKKRPPLTPQQKALAERNIGLAWKAATVTTTQYMGLCRALGGFDEIVSIAYEALLEAARNFDPAKGKFSTYASVCCKRWILSSLGDVGFIRVPKYLAAKKEKPQLPDRSEMHHNLELSSPREGEGDPALIAQDREEAQARKAALYKAIGQLRPKLQHLIRRRYFENAQYCKIAEELGVCRQWCHWACKDALRQLKDLMPNPYHD